LFEKCLLETITVAYGLQKNEVFFYFMIGIVIGIVVGVVIEPYPITTL
jgi:hypothetical protein